MARKKRLAPKYVVRRILFALILLLLLAGIVWLLVSAVNRLTGKEQLAEGSLTSPVSTSSESQSSSSSSSSSCSEPSSSSSSSQPEQSSSESLPESSSSESSRHADYTADWNLLLVNQEYPLGYEFSVELDTPYPPYRFDKRASAYLVEMIEAARADGIQLQLISTYRDLETQYRLFNNKVNEYLNMGYGQEDAEKNASQWVAIPGTSEHGTGLAADIVSATKSYELNESFAQSEEFEWLYANCTKYGFILRYPKDKLEITKITYEPWHYRYVGKEAAQEIMERGICLEEYVAEKNTAG